MLSHVQLLAIPMDYSLPGFPLLHYPLSLLKLMSTESVIPPDHLILCRPLLLLPPVPPSIRVFSNKSALRIRWPKYCSFSFSISPSNEYSGLISFRIDFAVQGILKSLFQCHSSKVSILWCSAKNYGPALTSIHDYCKNDSFDYLDFCQQSDVSTF